MVAVVDSALLVDPLEEFARIDRGGERQA